MDCLMNWASVTSAFIGVVLGFVASMGVAMYNQHKAKQLAQEDRRRLKLEELYITTINVNSEYNDLLKQAILKMNSNTPINIEYGSGVAPIIRLDMIMNLYFSNLKEQYVDFMSAKSEFGKAFNEILIANFESYSKENKQKITTNIFDLKDHVENKIKLIQYEVMRMITI